MARKVKTIKGILGKLEEVRQINIDEIKNYDKLPEDKKQMLSFLIGEVNNFIGEIETLKDQ